MSTFGALKCDFCNGGLIIDNSQEFAVCEYCGTKYMASTLRDKIQEIKGTVNIEGAVETTIGKNEKARLLKNAETKLISEDIKGALYSYSEIIDKFPNDITAYEKVLNIMVNYGQCLYYNSSKPTPGYEMVYGELKLFREFINLYERYSKAFVDAMPLEHYVDLFTDNIISGKIRTNFIPLDIPNERYKKRYTLFNTEVYNAGKKNAAIINEIDLLPELLDCASRKVFYKNDDYKCDFYYNGYCIYVTGGSTYSAISERKISTEQLNILLNNKRKERNLCQHCGGNFKGLFSKICSKCGKAKDY